MKSDRPTIYLAGPINGCTGDEIHHWREDVKEILGDAFMILDPSDRDYRGMECDPAIAREIVRRDQGLINHADILLVWHPRPSTGTDMEIYHAAHCRRIPVIVVIPDGSPVSPWVLAHTTFLAGTLSEACAYIQINYGGNT
jgi:nucleoside 2-deoxyribosyltransferase